MSNEKSNEVPAPAAPEPEYAAFVALDWADRKHDWQLVAAGSQKREKGEFDNTPEAVMAWVANLSERFGSRPIAVSLEQSRRQRCRVAAVDPVAASGPVTAPAAGYRRDAPVAAPGGTAAADGE